MPFDLNQWLAEVTADGSLSEAERKVVADTLAKDPKVLKRLEEGQLRQSDYSRHMNDLKRQEQTLKATETALNQWKSEAEGKLNAAVAERDALKTTAAQYEANVRAIASEYGLDPAEVSARLKAGLPAIAPGTTPPAHQQSGTPTMDTSKFLTREELEKQFQTAQQAFPLLQATIIDLNAEHMRLFGQPLANATELTQKAMEQKRSIREVWEEENRVADRRTQIASEAKAAEEARIRADERQKVLSEHSVPLASRPGVPHSAVFQLAGQSQQQNGGNATPPVPAALRTAAHENRGVEAAVRAFNEGKYRQQQTT
jgi:hypothetical protein